MGNKNFFVWYNGKIIADFCSLKGAIKYTIRRKDLDRGEYKGSLYISDRTGQEYSPYTGTLMETI